MNRAINGIRRNSVRMAGVFAKLMILFKLVHFKKCILEKRKMGKN
jgi:hypothetical protein